MDVAATLTSGVFQEVYRQIDPIKLAEDARLLDIAGHYGKILASASRNLKDGAIERLLKEYPSHECIIDRTEAGEMFNSVRAPEKDEQNLLRLLGPLATNASVGLDESYLIVLSELKKKGNADESENQGEQLERKRKRGKSNKPGDSRVPSAGSGAPAETERTKGVGESQGS